VVLSCSFQMSRVFAIYSALNQHHAQVHHTPFQKSPNCFLDQQWVKHVLIALVQNTLASWDHVYPQSSRPLSPKIVGDGDVEGTIQNRKRRSLASCTTQLRPSLRPSPETALQAIIFQRWVLMLSSCRALGSSVNQNSVVSGKS
jgi:hypothetical protein